MSTKTETREIRCVVSNTEKVNLLDTRFIRSMIKQCIGEHCGKIVFPNEDSIQSFTVSGVPSSITDDKLNEEFKQLGYRVLSEDEDETVF